MRRTLAKTLFSAAVLLTPTASIASADEPTLNLDLWPVVQAKKGNAKVCLGPINDLAEKIIGKHKHGTSGFFDVDRDDSYYSAMIVVNNGKENETVHLMAMPQTNGDCVISYSMTFMMDLSCERVRKSVPAAKDNGWLAGIVNRLTVNNMDLFLKPDGAARCLVSQKEVLTFRA